jgi:hypothetical protein
MIGFLDLSVGLGHVDVLASRAVVSEVKREDYTQTALDRKAYCSLAFLSLGFLSRLMPD